MYIKSVIYVKEQAFTSIEKTRQKQVVAYEVGDWVNERLQKSTVWITIGHFSSICDLGAVLVHMLNVSRKIGICIVKEMTIKSSYPTIADWRCVWTHTLLQSRGITAEQSQLAVRI